MSTIINDQSSRYDGGMNAKTAATVSAHPYDAAALTQLGDRLLSLEKAQRMAQFFGLLADTNRLRIVSLLAERELCVGDIALALGMSESAVSHQLRILKTMRLVSFRRQGRHMFYQLLDQHIFALYQSVAEHLDEEDEP